MGVVQQSADIVTSPINDVTSTHLRMRQQQEQSRRDGVDWVFNFSSPTTTKSKITNIPKLGYFILHHSRTHLSSQGTGKALLAASKAKNMRSSTFVFTVQQAHTLIHHNVG